MTKSDPRILGAAMDAVNAKMKKPSAKSKADDDEGDAKSPKVTALAAAMDRANQAAKRSRTN